MLPYVMIQTQEELKQPQVNPENEVPPRIRVAVHLIEFFTAKTATRSFQASEWSSQEIPGQELEVEERKLLLEACKVVEKYIQGK